MGNASDSLSKMLSTPEYKSGKILFNGIKSNSRFQILEAIDTVKKENIRASSGEDHETKYDDMIQKMTNYLTGQYDVGHGILSKKTPLEYAHSLAADQAIRCLEEAIASINKQENSDVKVSKTVGTVDTQRVKQAKERLREFQKEKK
jgi:hypothetical protein